MSSWERVPSFLMDPCPTCRRRLSSSSASLGGSALKKLVEFGRCMVALSAREFSCALFCRLVGMEAHL